MKEVNRKNFRFPAYDDETGVKLNSTQNRVLFEDEADFLTKNDDYQKRNKRTAAVPKPKIRTEEKSYRRSSTKRSAQPKTGLEKHKTNLPGYSSNPIKKAEETRRFEKTSSPAKRTEEKRAAKPGRSYFVPKYIPASIIPDPKKSMVTEEELLRSMEKSADSYLLFDTEPTPFQEKKDGDPTVRAFNRKEKEESRKAGVLERSLAGMIEEQNDKFEDTGYFK
ncbi:MULTISPECIES: hypothetical protein [unclassified Enterococcus]|jgi:hypothetical protein|uniref:hypothetical protein n=1 Tax=unclassified Enterococcus TaxID=2608891 RepID=UPI003D27239C